MMRLQQKQTCSKTSSVRIKIVAGSRTKVIDRVINERFAAQCSNWTRTVYRWRPTVASVANIDCYRSAKRSYLAFREVTCVICFSSVCSRHATPPVVYTPSVSNHGVSLTRGWRRAMYEIFLNNVRSLKIPRYRHFLLFPLLRVFLPREARVHAYCYRTRSVRLSVCPPVTSVCLTLVDCDLMQ